MPCSSCYTEFGIFKKEVVCKACGFSFCTKCCSKRSIANAEDSNHYMLCAKCFKQMSGTQESRTEHSPPAAHKKRMEKLANRSLSLGAKSFENEKDREIADRLQKLKRERIKEIVPSQNDLEERLAKLKGMDPSKYTAPPIQVFRPADRRSSTEQADGLMKQIQEEVELDESRVKPEDEIAARLAKLKGDSPSEPIEPDVISKKSLHLLSSAKEMDIDNEAEDFAKQQQISEAQVLSEIKDLQSNPNVKPFFQKSERSKEQDESDNDMDEDTEADKIIQQLLASEVNQGDIEELDNLNGTTLPSPTESNKKTPDEDVEEFPWCIICTENATIRCFGCENDLYCMRCFKECHDSIDIREHKTCPYLRPKGIKNL